ncbi:hypothetical protein HDU91_001823 [Kappamyces sp. JEL0680]|nr:hypothetical protein HDU91_001823 [Kappamyces sp. JEL0680]
MLPSTALLLIASLGAVGCILLLTLLIWMCTGSRVFKSSPQSYMLRHSPLPPAVKEWENTHSFVELEEGTAMDGDHIATPPTACSRSSGP